MVEQLLSESVNNDEILKYNLKMNKNLDNSAKKFYVYAIFITGKSASNLRYIGKGTYERCMAHFRVAYLCMKYGVQPQTRKTEQLINHLKSKKDFLIKKTSLKQEKDALIRETVMLQDVQSKNLSSSNVVNSSIDVSKYNLDRATIKEVKKDTIQELFNSRNDIAINSQILEDDFKKEFGPFVDKFDQNDTETELSKKVFLLKIGSSLISSLSGLQKLIVLSQVLIYLDRGKTLSNEGIEQLLIHFNLAIPKNKSTIYSCFAVYVRKLVFCKNYVVKIFAEIKNLKIEIQADAEKSFRTFEQWMSEIVKKSRELLDTNNYNRKIAIQYSSGDLYALNRIVEVSRENGQFLNLSSNVKLYKKLTKSYKDEHREMTRYMLCKIKMTGGYHTFNGLDGKLREKIDRRVVKYYNRLVKDDKNHMIDKSLLTQDQRYVIFTIKAATLDLELCERAIREIYYSCSPVGKALSPSALKLHIIRTDLSHARKYSQALTQDRRNFIEQKVKEQTKLHQNEKKMNKTHHSDSFKYVALNLKIKGLEHKVILNTLIANNLTDKVQLTVPTLTSWFSEHHAAPEISDPQLKGELDNIIQQAIDSRRDASPESKYPSEVRYVVLNLCNKLTSTAIFQTLQTNDLPGPMFKSLVSFRNWLTRNQKFSPPTIHDEQLKQRLDTIVQQAISSNKQKK